MSKIGLLIPTTSRNQVILNPLEMTLFKLLIPTMLASLTKDEKIEHSITIFLGLDDNDVVFNDINFINNINIEFKNLTNGTNIELILIVCSDCNHNPVKVWNILHKVAFDNGCDYFYQLGDDIQFLTSGWITRFIDVLPQYKIGIVGGFDINIHRPDNLITQSFVNRNHMKIFGYYYPNVFTNWYSDNWIQNVYGENTKLLDDVKIKNAGGPPKYKIDNKEKILMDEIVSGQEKIEKYENMEFVFHNIYHLGDCVFHIHYLRKVCFEHPKYIFKFHCNPLYHQELQEQINEYENQIKLHDLTNIPAESIDSWIGCDRFYFNHPNSKNYNEFYCDWFIHMSKIIGIDSPIKTGNDMLSDNPKLLEELNLESKYDVLVINSIPHSNQFNYNETEIDELINILISQNKNVITTKKTQIPNVPATTDFDLNLNEYSIFHLIFFIFAVQSKKIQL